MTQNQKLTYLSDLIDRIGRQPEFVKAPHCRAVTLAGTDFVHCTPGLLQVLAGDDFPDDMNVRINIQVISDHKVERVEWLDYKLTFNEDIDLRHFKKVMQHWRIVNKQ